MYSKIHLHYNSAGLLTSVVQMYNTLEEVLNTRRHCNWSLTKLCNSTAHEMNARVFLMKCHDSLESLENSSRGAKSGTAYPSLHEDRGRHSLKSQETKMQLTTCYILIDLFKNITNVITFNLLIVQYLNEHLNMYE